MSGKVSGQSDGKSASRACKSRQAGFMQRFLIFEMKAAVQLCMAAFITRVIKWDLFIAEHLTLQTNSVIIKDRLLCILTCEKPFPADWDSQNRLEG
ncbi:MAG: hypothetical protein ACLSFT_00085 [Ruminococcus callidus]